MGKRILYQKTFMLGIITAQHQVNVEFTASEKTQYAPFNEIIVINKSTEDISIRKGASTITGDILIYVPAGLTMAVSDTGFTDLSAFNEDAANATTANEVIITVQRTVEV